MGSPTVTDHSYAPIVIIGAGMGGLTLAAICSKLNLKFILLERTKVPTPVGAGISLAPNALRVLDQLGIYDSIKENGQPLHTMQVHFERKKWRSMDFRGVKTTFGYPVYSIERALLHKALLEAAGGESAVEWGMQVTDIVEDKAKGCVLVKTASGKTFVGDVVAGADGIRSVTRRVLAREAGLESINTISFTGRVHMSGYTKPIPHLGKEHLGVGNWSFYDDAILTTWPCKDNRQWYIGVKVRESLFS